MRLILNGDDFGLTSGVNQGVVRAFQGGLLTSASLMANGEAAEEAISLARANPGLDMGVHLALCDEHPLLPPSELPSILPSGGRFPSRGHVLRAIGSGSIDYGEVEAEWRAQVERVLEAGVRLSHLDSHQYVHLLPGLWKVCLNLAKTYRIPFIRAWVADPGSRGIPFRRLVQWLGIRLWTRAVVPRFTPPNVQVLPSVGFWASGGRLNQKTLFHLLDALRTRHDPPAVEVVLHPGIGDDHTTSAYQWWGYDWKRDLDLLTEASLKEELALRDMTPGTFWDAL